MTKMYCTTTFFPQEIFSKSPIMVKDRCNFIPYFKAMGLYITP